MNDLPKDEAIELAREAGVVDGPKILMMATPDELHRLAQAAFKLGRNSGLEEAALCMEEQDTQAPKYNAKAIRSLKDNTP